MTTGEKIKQLRMALGMSQEELGKIVGVKKAAIYKYENGIVVNLKRSTIEKLASALGTTPMYLLNLEEKPTADDSDGLSKEEIELLKSLSKQIEILFSLLLVRWSREKMNQINKLLFMFLIKSTD